MMIRFVMNVLRKCRLRWVSIMRYIVMMSSVLIMVNL